MQYSKLSSKLSTDKFVSLKVVEAHYTAPDTITYCSNFERNVNDVPTKLGVRVQIQQDVGPQAMNPCHSSNEPSEECVFTTVNASSSLLQFSSEEGKDSNSFEVSSQGGGAKFGSPTPAEIFSSGGTQRWMGRHKLSRRARTGHHCE